MLFNIERAVQRTSIWTNCSSDNLHPKDKNENYVDDIYLFPSAVRKIKSLTFLPSIQKGKYNKPQYLQGQVIPFTERMTKFTKVCC